MRLPSHGIEYETIDTKKAATRIFALMWCELILAVLYLATVSLIRNAMI